MCALELNGNSVGGQHVVKHQHKADKGKVKRVFAQALAWVFRLSSFANAIANAIPPCRQRSSRSALAFFCFVVVLGTLSISSAMFSKHAPLLPGYRVLDLNSARYSTAFTVKEWASRNSHCLHNWSVSDMDGKSLKCCLQSLRRRMPLSVTGRDAKTLWSKGFSKSFLKLLPDAELPQFGTCAVISNAPSISKFNLSHEIDSFDAVFRLNKAPVVGFENIVGSKETVRVINLHSGVPTDESVLPSLVSGNAIVYVRQALDDLRRHRNLSKTWDTRQFASRGMVSEYMYLKQRYPLSRIYLNHPVFAQFSLRYLHVKLMGPTKQTMSTGTQAVLLALMLCDRVTSYEVATDDELSRSRRYYYDTRPVSYHSAHPQNRETLLLELLSTRRRDGSRIYEFDMTEDNDSCNGNINNANDR